MDANSPSKPEQVEAHSSPEEPFFRWEGDTLVATENTRGPWSADHQHGGPPSALLVREAERLLPDLCLARITCEWVRPVPIGPVQVQGSSIRTGRKTTTVFASLSAEGKTCIEARILMVRPTPVTFPRLQHCPPPLPPLETSPFAFSFFPWSRGYHTAMELRLVRGQFGKGNCAMWMRQKGPLVQGDEPSGPQRVVVCADAGSGITLGLDPRRYQFLNADLTVHLFDAPSGPWILLDGATWTREGGTGLAQTTVSDQEGVVGSTSQTLILEERR